MDKTIRASNGKEICIYCVLEQMRTCGGAFVKKLGELWWSADTTNRIAVMTTWEGYFVENANDCVVYKHKCRHKEI